MTVHEEYNGKSKAASATFKERSKSTSILNTGVLVKPSQIHHDPEKYLKLLEAL